MTEQGAPGRLSRRLHGRGRPRSLHGPDLSRTLLEPTAFVTEPTGHLVATFTLDRKGSDVVDYYGWNLLASDDEWTAPIGAEVGPDGHVWVIDWYNYIVQHNPTPHGFRTGTGNAYETPIRDKTHGRIYRIVYKDAAGRGRPCSIPAIAAGLVAALAERQPALADACPAPSGRARANRRRARAGQAGERPLGRRDRTERRRDPCALDAARSGRAADGRNRGARSGRRGARASVRRRPPQCDPGLPRDAAFGGAIVAAGLLRDPDAQVRLAAFLGLADQPAEAMPRAAVVAALLRRRGRTATLAGGRGHRRGGQERRWRF